MPEYKHHMWMIWSEMVNEYVISLKPQLNAQKVIISEGVKHNLQSYIDTGHKAVFWAGGEPFIKTSDPEVRFDHNCKRKVLQ